MTRFLSINWLVPEPFPGAGGDTGLFRIIRYLAEFGHECHVYVVAYSLMNNYSTEEVREYVAKHFGQSRAHYHRWTGSVRDADATFATFWPTAENVLALPNGGLRCYLVQDFEPAFYPDDPPHYQRAEDTYRAGLRCITLGPWLTRHLREKYNARADYFDFAVDHETYWPRPISRTSGACLCFYARPSTPRRAYSLGLEALALVKARQPALEIVFFGTDNLEPQPGFPIVNRGIISHAEMANLFSASDVGVVFSLTNPSFVPLEMMACGCAVLEIDSERWSGILHHGHDAWLVPQTANAVADGIELLLKDKALRSKLIANGIERVSKLSWRESARQIERILLAELSATR